MAVFMSMTIVQTFQICGCDRCLIAMSTSTILGQDLSIHPLFELNGNTGSRQQIQNYQLFLNDAQCFIHVNKLLKYD